MASELGASVEAKLAKVTGVVVDGANEVATQYRVVRFRNRPMILVNEPYPHYVPLTSERFYALAYPLLGGVTRSRMADIFAYLSNTTEDLTQYEHLILFGVPLADMIDSGNIQADTDVAFLHANKPRVWNMRTLQWEASTDPDLCIWRSPYAPVSLDAESHGSSKGIPFLLSLAGGHADRYNDILQSMAPLVMDEKPDGAVWWVGDGANGKSTLMDAIWRIFPGQLASITVKRLADGRDTPSLNGMLANVVKESSEGRIDDTEIYKAIGTHEDFRVHKFHSQDDVTIKGNLHHIFSANQIPVFNDKGWSARRRTFIVPFDRRFESDPQFEKKTFTPLLFGQMITAMTQAAQQVARQGYRYKFSADTMRRKEEYDSEVNSAEDYITHIIDEGVVAFDSYIALRVDYENWCADNGFTPLGLGNLRRSARSVGFDRRNIAGSGGANKQYQLDNLVNPSLQIIGVGRPGIYTTPGFVKAEPAAVPEFKEPQPSSTEPAEPKSAAKRGAIHEW